MNMGSFIVQDLAGDVKRFYTSNSEVKRPLPIGKKQEERVHEG